MTKLELQNKIATIEKSMAKITNPAVLAIAEKNLKEAREQLAALEGATPSPAPSGGGSELEKLYEQREKLRKGLQSSNAVVQKASKMALPKVEAQIAELEGARPAPAPARRMPKPKAETPEVPATKPIEIPAKRGRKPSPPAPMPIPTPAKRGRKPKAESPMPMPTPAKRGRKPKAEAPAEVKGIIKRGRKPKAQAPAEAPAVTPARRGRPALPKGAKSQEVSLNSLTKLANAIVEFCGENGIANPTLDDVRGILNILDKNKALKFAKGGKISRSGKYLSKWQIKQILTDGGMKIGSDEILSGVWLKKKVDGVAEMRMGGGVGYFAIKDDIIESRKSVRFGNRRVSSRNPKVVGVLEGKMVGNLMKVYDYDDEMWKVVNPDEWQQAYADGGGVGIPNAAWFVFQEKFPEAFEYYLKNNEYGVSKGDLMAMAYESTRNVDSAIPMELWKQVDDTMFYVYDYQNSSFGELVDLREKIKTSEVPVALSFVIDMHGYYGDDLPNELKNADFATALMYVYANRDVIDEFQIRPKRNVDNYAEGGEVESLYEKLLSEFQKEGYEKFGASFNSFLNTKQETAYERKNYELAKKIDEVRKRYENDFYAKGGGIGNCTLADYKANEEINHHSENALMLTKMYGTQDEINEVERLIKKGEREFGFSMEDYRRLYEISNKYYKHLVEASKRK